MVDLANRRTIVTVKVPDTFLEIAASKILLEVPGTSRDVSLLNDLPNRSTE